MWVFRLQQDLKEAFDGRACDDCMDKLTLYTNAFLFIGTLSDRTLLSCLESHSRIIRRACGRSGQPVRNVRPSILNERQNLLSHEFEHLQRVIATVTVSPSQQRCHIGPLFHGFAYIRTTYNRGQHAKPAFLGVLDVHDDSCTSNSVYVQIPESHKDSMVFC